MKNHDVRKNGMFLLCSDYIMCEKRSISYNQDVFLPIFSTSYPFLQISTWVLASQYRCMCLTIQMHVPLIIWGIWLSTKAGVKSSFFYFGPFHSCDVICWPKDRNYANMALGPMGRWPCHYLENKSWTSRGTSGVLWLIHVSLMWSNMHLTNKGCPHSFWS